MFASKSVMEHLARGGLGLGALLAAGSVATSQPWLALPTALVGLVALRGCPMCWTMVLLQTLQAKLLATKPQDQITGGIVCADGRCAAENQVNPDRGPVQ